MRLLVGCPVKRRDWIIDKWFDYLSKSASNAGLDFDVCFVADELDAIYLRPLGSVVVDNDGVDTEEREWTVKSRIENLARVRNILLSYVQSQSPDLFLSLDSDMLLHPDALSSMLDVLNTKEYKGIAAVGGKTYMDILSVNSPSFACLIDGSDRFTRFDSDEVRKVDVLMGIKLMTPAAYHQLYKYDRRGEDFGWSLSCREAGLGFWWDGRVGSKHCMTHNSLNRVDSRVGF